MDQSNTLRGDFKSEMRGELAATSAVSPCNCSCGRGYIRRGVGDRPLYVLTAPPSKTQEKDELLSYRVTTESARMDLKGNRVKLVVLGGEAVGKTAIVRRFLKNTFQVSLIQVDLK